MDVACAAMNDNNKALYTYAVQNPYVRMALRDVEQDFMLSGVTINLVDDISIPVLKGETELSLPPSFFLPISLLERSLGSTTEAFTPMTEKAFADDDSPIPALSVLSVWDFRHNCINFNACTTDREVKLNFWRTLPAILNENQTGYLVGAVNVLGFKTAGYLAKFIGNNPDRFMAVNGDYQDSLDKLLSLYVKNNQGKRVRRKPFRLNNTGPYINVRVP